MAADRYSYLPCMSFAMLAGAATLGGMARRVGTSSRRMGWAWAIPVVVGGLLGTLTWRQCRVWKDDSSLWNHAIGVDRNSSMAYQNAAVPLVKNGKLEAASHLLLRAIRLNPANADAHTNLGIALRRIGRVDEAMRHYQEAERLRPGSEEIQYNIALLLAEEPLLDGFGLATQEQQWQAALERYQRVLALRPDHMKALNDLGILYKKMGQLDQAMRYYEAVLRLDPDDVKALYNLANAWAAAEQPQAAESQYRRVLAEAPGHVEARVNLAELLQRRGRFREAVSVLRDGPDRGPGNSVLMNNLAWLLAAAPDDRCRDGAEALRIARQLCDQSGATGPRTLDLLAAAHAETGGFDDAIATALAAIQLAQELRMPQLAESIEQRLALYRTGRPFRLTPVDGVEATP